MDRLRLKLLGGFEARLGDGAALPLPSRKAQALLAYLALSAGRAHPRDKLATLLWGDISQEHARSSLRQALFAIRKALAPVDGALHLEAENVALSPERVDVDVVEFERQVRVGSPEALQAAADAYGGDLLEGLAVQESPFEEWLTAERERLRERALEVLVRLLASQREQGRAEAAIQTAVRLLALDQLQEPVHRTLMRLHAQLGRRGSALRQYQLCVGVLQRELGVEPEPETKQLYQEILRQRQARHVDAPTSAASRLPVVASGTGVPLVGRDAELARLRDGLADVDGGCGRVAMVLGEAGIGKTRLIGAVAHAASELGFQVLLGRSRENEQILPFGPWVEAFRSARIPNDGDLLAQLAPGWRAELARLFPEVAPGTMAAERADDRRLFESVVQLVEHLATRRPILLVLEDLHWADDMSLRLLSFLGGRITGQRVAIVGTARAEELLDAPDLRRTLGELARETDVLQLTLAPLSRPETLSLVRTLSRTGTEESELGRLGERVWRGSQGNPFMVVEMLRALRQGAESAGSESESLPQRIRDVVARRLQRLSDRGQQLAATAAVIGRDFEFELLEAATGMPEEDAAAGVEELVRRRVLHGVGERFDFTHDRIREVVYTQLLAPRRKLLHRRVGDAIEIVYAQKLEDRPMPFPGRHYPPGGVWDMALGFHYGEGEEWGKAVRYLRWAAASARGRSANREGVACLDRALDALAHQPDTRHRTEDVIDIHLELEACLMPLGDLPRIAACVREAERLAHALGDEMRLARVLGRTTYVLASRGDLAGALDAGERALGFARRRGDAAIEVTTNVVLARARYAMGDYGQALAHVRANEEIVHRERPAAEAMADPRLRFSSGWAVAALAEIGEFAEGVTRAEAYVRVAETVFGPHEQAVACFFAGRLYVVKGELARAIAILERGLSLCEGDGELAMYLSRTGSPLGLAYALSGRVAEGLSVLERVAAQGEAIGFRFGHALVVANLGEAQLLAGDFDEAQRHAERALALAREADERGWEAWTLRLHGGIAARRGLLDDAKAHYLSALALAEPRGMRPLIAHCQRGLGRVAREIGNRGDAAMPLATAASMYHDMGMTLWSQEMATEIT